MHIASREENQQLAAIAVAAEATVFCHFRTHYKLNIVSSYIWMDSRLKGLSIESKNTQNGVRTKKLCVSEVGGLTLCRSYAIAWNPTPRRAIGCTQPRYGVASTPRRARGCLGSFGTRPFSTRNHPGTALVHRRQYPPNLDHMICHKHGTKTILQSIPIHPKSRNKPTSISIHIFLISILKTKTTIQRGKNPIPRCKSYNSTHILYKTKDPYKFHTRIHTKLQRSIQVLLITFCVHVHVSCLFHMAFHILVQYDVYVFTHHSYILIPL